MIQIREELMHINIMKVIMNGNIGHMIVFFVKLLIIGAQVGL